MLNVEKHNFRINLYINNVLTSYLFENLRAESICAREQQERCVINKKEDGVPFEKCLRFLLYFIFHITMKYFANSIGNRFFF